jgi:hypothetical protein
MRFLILCFLFLALPTASAFAADTSSGTSGVVHAGGLICFFGACSA